MEWLNTVDSGSSYCMTGGCAYTPCSSFCSTNSPGCSFCTLNTSGSPDHCNVRLCFFVK